MTKITIVDYSNGNSNSILRALNSIGANADFSSKRRDIEQADFLILPGVGHAGTAMASLQSNRLIEPLRDAVLGRKVPVLGICLGMHLMLDYVEEGACAALGWVRGRAVAMTVHDRRRFKVPHIGWNTVDRQPGPQLLSNLSTDDRSFYFCHKYTVEGVEEVGNLSSFHYESERIASFDKGQIFGVQFHPEKSHEAGEGLFRSFLGSGC